MSPEINRKENEIKTRFTKYFDQIVSVLKTTIYGLTPIIRFIYVWLATTNAYRKLY